MTDPAALAEYVGFTEPEVEGLCAEFGKNFDEVCRWYDGYRSADEIHIYNPKSMVDSMKR